MRKLLLLCRLPQWLINKILPYTFDQAKQAIIKNDIQALTTIMNNEPNFSEDDNILMLTLNEGKEETILFLIQRFQHQLDFQRRNQKGDSPLMVAIFRKKKQAVRTLLPFSQVKACDFFRNTPFIAAAANGDIQTMELLLANPDCYANAKNIDGHTALHRACYFGEIAAIEWLLDKTNLKIGELDTKGNNGLHLACSGAQIATTRYLIAKVKNPEHLMTQNHDGKTPFDVLMDTLHRLGGIWKQSDLHLEHFKRASL